MEEEKVQENSSLSPYYIHPSEGRETIITTVQLKVDNNNNNNYEDWSKHVRDAMRTKRKLCFLDETLKKPESATELNQWELVNSMIVVWIMNTIEPTLRKSISVVEDASVLWKDLKLRFSVKKKYGLQIRATPRPWLRNVTSIFGEDDEDDDDVEKDIFRQAASKTKALKKDIEEDDPSAFAYDEVYDHMKHKETLPDKKDRKERKPRYIKNLMKQAERRQKEHEIVYERKLAKEREKEEHLFPDKEKFIGSAYKRKLEEQNKWVAEERLRQLQEEEDDVTKKKDLSDFYFNIGKNLAFGAQVIESKEAERLKEQRKEDKLRNTRTSRRKRVEPQEVEPTTSEKKMGSDVIEERDSSIQEAVEETKKKRVREDAIAAAKERFLARAKKKAKVEE